MKTSILAAAALLASITTPAAALERCKWYVHEADHSRWIVNEGDRLFAPPVSGQTGGIKLEYLVYSVPGRQLVQMAEWNGVHHDASQSFLFRFVDVNRERVLIADMELYFQTCEEPKLPPA